MSIWNCLPLGRIVHLIIFDNGEAGISGGRIKLHACYTHKTSTHSLDRGTPPGLPSNRPALGPPSVILSLLPQSDDPFLPGPCIRVVGHNEF